MEDTRKPVVRYAFDEQTRYYVGVAMSYPDPMGDGYYHAENTTHVAPPDFEYLGYGMGYWLSSDGETWNAGIDYSNCEFYDKLTGERVYGLSLQAGTPMPPDVVHMEPPPAAKEMGGWPCWDEVLGEWVIGRDMTGVEWYTLEGEEGVCNNPWDKLPDGAIEGLSPIRIKNLRFKEQMARVNEIKASIEALKYMLESSNNEVQNSIYTDMLEKYRECLELTINVNIEDMSGNFEFPDIPELTI